MTDLLQRCAVCQALLDDEDLFCSNCGTESPLGKAGQLPGSLITTHRFQCAGCGASMSYDADVQKLRCPFCGGDDLESKGDAPTLSPQLVVRFDKEQDDALKLLKTWMGKNFWSPTDLADAAIITRLTAVYVPYWVFTCHTATNWTADSSQTPSGARASWYPVAGQHQSDYGGILIGASGVLTPAETHALGAYDLAVGVPPEDVDLEDSIYEPFSVQRKYAKAQVRDAIDDLERDACRQYVPGNARNVHVNVRVDGLTSKPVLLPVWVMAYQYRGKLFRFLVNGQTGRCTGTAPTSYTKVAIAVGIGIVVVAAVVVGFLVCAGVMSR
jgi:hypothetical protein